MPEATEKLRSKAIKFNKMNKITTYFRESYRELLEKVTWPSWTQLQQSTVIVLVATLLITLIVWIMDVISSSVLHLIYSFFGS
jgi:preprotein translocase subunit SecE